MKSGCRSITSKAVVSGWRGIGGDPRVWAGGTSGGSSCAGWRGFGGGAPPPPPPPPRGGGGGPCVRPCPRPPPPPPGGEPEPGAGRDGQPHARPPRPRRRGREQQPNVGPSFHSAAPAASLRSRQCGDRPAG